MIESVDLALLKRIIDGDSSAFRQIVESYQNLVYSVAIKVLGNEKDAEDATQEAFLKAYKNLKSFRLESKFSTWLYKIAYHTCLDMAKLKHNKTNWNDIESVEWKLPDSDKRDHGYDLDAALMQLPLKLRQIVVMFYYNHFSYKEISDILSESESNVKTLLYRARQNMKHVLEESQA